MFSCQRDLKRIQAENAQLRAQIAQVQAGAIAALEMVNERDYRIEALRRKIGRVDSLLEKVQTLERIIKRGLTVSRSYETQRKITRINELHKRGIANNAIELEVFGYCGGYAYNFVARVVASVPDN